MSTTTTGSACTACGTPAEPDHNLCAKCVQRSIEGDLYFKLHNGMGDRDALIAQLREMGAWQEWCATCDAVEVDNQGDTCEGCTPVREVVTTDQLRQGDVIESHGMRLVLDQPIQSSGLDQIVYYTKARIDNWDELVAEAALNPSVAFIVNMSRYDQRWTVQGNDLAHWCRVGQE